MENDNYRRAARKPEESHGEAYRGRYDAPASPHSNVYLKPQQSEKVFENSPGLSSIRLSYQGVTPPYQQYEETPEQEPITSFRARAGTDQGLTSMQLIQEMRQRRETPPQVDQSNVTHGNTQQELFSFKKSLLSTLSKFGKQHTQAQASEELKRLMTSDITDNDRMTMFLNNLADLNEHMSVGQMKEQIKQFGVAAEIFEDALVPYVPKMMASFQKRIKEEGSTRLHVAISETIGQLVWNIVDKLDDRQQKMQLFEQQFLRMPFSILDKSTNKVHHCAAISCLTKIVINCPDEILYEHLEHITDRIIQQFDKKNFIAHQQLLECLISIIFHIQDEFRYYYDKFLPLLVSIIKKTSDPGTKRVAIDAIYSIGAHLSNEILQAKDELLTVLDKCRTDKNQPVRAAAQETIKLLKELDMQKSQGGGLSMFDGQELNEQNSEFFDKPPNIDGDDEEQIEKNPNESYLANIRKSQIVQQHAVLVDDVEYEPTFKVEKIEARRATVQDTDAQSSIKPFTRATVNKLNVDRCKSPTLMSSQMESTTVERKSNNTHLGNYDDRDRPGSRQQKTTKSGTSGNNARNQHKSPYRKTYSKAQLEVADSIPNKPAIIKQTKTPTRPKSMRKALRSPNQTNNKSAALLPPPEMSLTEIEEQQKLLLDTKYLQDKSVKKPSLATLKRRKRQKEQEEKDSQVALTEPSRTVRSNLNQREQLQSIQDLKNAFKQKQNQGVDKFAMVEEKKEKPYSSIFKGKMNQDFLKSTPQQNDEDITVFAAPKPADFEEMLQMQQEAEERYAREREEEERKYEGLTALQKKKLILAELEEAQNEGKGKKPTNERSKWAPEIKKQGSAKTSKKEKREIINNDVVIKVGKKVPMSDDEEAEEIVPPKKVVKKPEPKKKAKERAPWVGVTEDAEDEQKEEFQSVSKPASKPVSIAWPSSTPIVEEKKQPLEEKKSSAEDLEYLEFQKYQENIRAAANRQNDSRDYYTQVLPPVQQKSDEMSELRQQLHQFQAQQQQIVNSFEKFQLTMLNIQNKVNSLENSIDSIKVQQNAMQSQINNQLYTTQGTRGMNDTNSMLLNETMTAMSSPSTPTDSTEALLQKLIQNQNKSKQNDLLSMLLKQQQMQQQQSSSSPDQQLLQLLLKKQLENNSSKYTNQYMQPQNNQIQSLLDGFNDPINLNSTPNSTQNNSQALYIQSLLNQYQNQ